MPNSNHSITGKSSFYKKHVVPNIDELEELRKSLQPARNVLLILTILVLLFVPIVAYSFFGKWLGSIYVYPFIIGCAFKLDKWIAESYITSFKDKIIRPLVHSFGHELDYEPNETIPLEIYKDSRLFENSVSRYHGDDCITGIIGKTKVLLGEVHHQQSSNNRKSSRLYTIFHGLFCIADFNKHLNGATVVVPDVNERLLGGLGKSIQKIKKHNDLPLVTLENQEFEKLFAVYSDDENEARYILTPDMMERIISFSSKHNNQRKVRISFFDQFAYIAIHSGALFEPKLSRVITKEDIDGHFDDMELAIGIIEDLNLNLRIWTKA